MKYHSLNILLLLFVTSSALAQQLPFRTYTAKDGLNRNAVRTICQDSKSFMWFGTTDGVDRYDGATFTHYTTANGLANNFVNKIIEDRDSNLWIATNYAGISKYTDGTFTNYLVAPNNPDGSENRVNTIYQDRDGKLWIGADGGLFQFDGERFTRLHSENTMLHRAVTAILEDSQRDIWIGTVYGLCKWQRASHPDYITIPNLDGFEITALAEDAQGNIWVGTDKGLKKINNRTRERTTHTTVSLPTVLQFLSDKWIRDLFIDSEPNLWIGTGGFGLCKYTSNGDLTTYTMANGLAGNNVVGICQDREGNLWFATTTGVSKLVGEQLVNYTVLDGLADHAVSSLVQDRQGNFWFGTRLGLSKLANGKITNYTMRHGLGANYVLSLLKDKTGSLWVGTINSVSKITSTRSGEILVTYGEQNGWLDIKGIGNRARSVYQDDEGNLWFGNDVGVSLFTDGRFMNYALKAEFTDRLVTGMVRDNQGDLWVGVLAGGIVRFSINAGTDGNLLLTEVARYHKEVGLIDDNIRASLKDRDGNLWFGTRHGGVSQFIMDGREIKAIRNFTTADGLSDNWVSAILQDRRGNLWFGTDGGADCLSMGGHGIPAFRHFTIKEGLAGDGVIALYEDERGCLWFGTSNGVTCYDPAKKTPDAPTPPVYITQFQIFGKPDSSALRKMRADLAYDQHSVAFEYIGISFKDETKVRYQYMLEGLDTEWSEVTDRRHVNYTHLPSGHYLFKVKAQNADGVWSVTPATFAFGIATPFWRSWWFIALTIIGAIGIISGVYRYRVRQIIEMERIRSKIATDLHDDLGSTLSSISVFSEMAKQETEKVAPKAAQMLQRIGESSRAMLEAIDDIVWAINPDNDALDHVILRLRDFATEMFEASGIAFTLNFPENINHLKLPMEMRRDFYLIFKEAVNNVVKHSRCRRAAVSITANEHHLALTMSDDGIGFNRNHSFSGNGIKNIEKCAKTIGGAVTIASQEGKGTTIILNVRIT